jgi:hypothetical protein
MNGAKKRLIGLIVLGLAALGLRLWAVLSLPNEPAWTAVAQLLQCFAGTAVVLAVACLGWTLVPDRAYVGWVAAWGTAIYPPHLALAGQPHVAAWATLALTLLLLVALLPQWNSSRRAAVVVGVLAGVLFVLEPVLALAVPVCVAVFWLAIVRRGGVRSPKCKGEMHSPDGQLEIAPTGARIALGRVALLLCVALLIAGPWMIRNHIVHGRLLAQDYTFASTAAASHGDLCLRRTQSLFLGSSDMRTPHAPREESHHAVRDEYVADATFLTRASYVAGVAWLVLILIGLSISWDRRRRLWPTYAIFATVAAAHILLVEVPWVRTVLEPMTLVWASLAVAPLLVRLAPPRKIKIHRPGQQANDPFAAEHALKGPHYEIPEHRRAG